MTTRTPTTTSTTPKPHHGQARPLPVDVVVRGSTREDVILTTSGRARVPDFMTQATLRRGVCQDIGDTEGGGSLMDVIRFLVGAAPEGGPLGR